MYAAYKDKVEFYLVYIREAHPVKEGKPAGDETRRPEEIAQTRSLDERVLAATDCLKGLKFSLPVLIDTMDGAAEKAYGGWPAATAVIDVEGKIRFHSRGPDGARPKEAEKVLRQLLPADDGPMAAEKPATTPPPKSEAAPQPDAGTKPAEAEPKE